MNVCVYSHAHDAGDVDVVMGGPPCQGISGSNRHAVRVNILDDSRYAKLPMLQPAHNGLA